MGSKKNPIWRVVVADQRSPRDGRVIETIGHYNAQTEPSTIVIDRERLDHWVERGAQPTNTVRKLMRAPNTVAAVVKPANVPEPQDVPEPAAGEAAGVAAESGTDVEAPGGAAPDDGPPEPPATPVEDAPAADAEARGWPLRRLRLRPLRRPSPRPTRRPLPRLRPPRRPTPRPRPSRTTRRPSRHAGLNAMESLLAYLARALVDEP